VRSEFQVRAKRDRDAAGVVAVAEALPGWFNAEGMASIRRDAATQTGAVAEQEGEVVGFALWEERKPATVEITWMAVSPKRQRGGIGRDLVAEVRAMAERQGADRLIVSTVADSVDYHPYVSTRAFYRAVGFQDFRVDKDFYGQRNDRYDRLLLELRW
jgi:ribosomal protein S18 acetylase RimI-like enzyme